MRDVGATIITKGSCKGMRVNDLSRTSMKVVLKECKNMPESKAVHILMNRKFVTSVLGDIPTPHIRLLERGNVPVITRDAHLCTRLYGYFVEILVKYTLGIRRFPCVDTYMRRFSPRDKNLKRLLGASYNNITKSPCDLVNYAALHYFGVNEENWVALLNHVSRNEHDYRNFTSEISANLPRLCDRDQVTCEDIAIGMLSGKIDLIASRTLVDIKCKSSDPILNYESQLYAYACLHRLRHGKCIDNCQIWNFMTGKMFELDVSRLTFHEAKEVVTNIVKSKDHVDFVNDATRWYVGI
jgi:hypothetical protein